MLGFKTLHDACFTDFIMNNPMKKPPVAISNTSRGIFFFCKIAGKYFKQFYNTSTLRQIEGCEKNCL
jgi:hypothetical protein